MKIRKTLFLLLGFVLGGCASSQVNPMSVENFAKRIESQEQGLNSQDTIVKSFDFKQKKALMYDVCIINYESNEIKYPCSMGDSSISTLLGKLTTQDTVRYINTSVKFVYYAAEIFNYQTINRRYNLFTGFSPIYVYEDKSKKAMCASVNSQNCSYLIVKLAIEKKFSDGLGKSFFVDVPLLEHSENISIDSILNRFYLDEAIMGVSDKETSTFELCWNGNGTSYPCNIDTSIIAEIKDSLDKDGHKIESMTYALDSTNYMALVYSPIAETPYCKTSPDGECRYIMVRSIGDSLNKDIKIVFYDRETKKLGDIKPLPASCLIEDEWPFHKPDGTSLRDYRWQ